MANEKRLIDANALKREFSTIADRSNLDYIFIDVISDAIEDAPTVDAVEVGRCKYCYYYEASNPGHGYCKYFDTLRIDNDYCSSWERKGNG